MDLEKGSTLFVVHWIDFRIWRSNAVLKPLCWWYCRWRSL